MNNNKRKPRMRKYSNLQDRKIIRKKGKEKRKDWLANKRRWSEEVRFDFLQDRNFSKILSTRTNKFKLLNTVNLLLILCSNTMMRRSKFRKRSLIRLYWRQLTIKGYWRLVVKKFKKNHRQLKAYYSPWKSQKILKKLIKSKRQRQSVMETRKKGRM